jgi:uncharacterized Zn-finger protein
MTSPLHKPFEVISVRSPEVACDGGSAVLGHPLVYLHIKPEAGEITCPYCSRTFILEQKVA